jgi:hypothetical protein
VKTLQEKTKIVADGLHAAKYEKKILMLAKLAKGRAVYAC